MNKCYNGTGETHFGNPLWKTYGTKFVKKKEKRKKKQNKNKNNVITTLKKTEKMNLVQSHRLLEVHRPLTLFDEVGHVTIWRSEYVHSQK